MNVHEFESMGLDSILCYRCNQPPGAEVHNVVTELQCPHNRVASTCVFCDPVGNHIGVSEWDKLEDEANNLATPSTEKLAAQGDRVAAQPPERIWIDPANSSMLWITYQYDNGIPYVSEASYDELVKALEFYADPRKYQGSNCRADADEESVAGYYRLDIRRDGGAKARKALGKERQ